jgi:hypothetical protein
VNGPFPELAKYPVAVRLRPHSMPFMQLTRLKIKAARLGGPPCQGRLLQAARVRRSLPRSEGARELCGGHFGVLLRPLNWSLYFGNIEDKARDMGYVKPQGSRTMLSEASMMVSDSRDSKQAGTWIELVSLHYYEQAGLATYHVLHQIPCHHQHILLQIPKRIRREIFRAKC